MKVKGVIDFIRANGYERLLLVRSGEGSIWCSYTQHNEYLEPNQSSKYLAIGDRVSLNVVLTLITIYHKVGKNELLGIFHSTEASPHVSVVGEVVTKISDDSYVVSVGNNMDLNLEFENDVLLEIGSRIRVEGELVAD